MAKTFKTTDLKEVGRVKISARGLREIANKLEQKTGSDTVVNLMVYLAPGETPNDYPELGYDFGSVTTEPKKTEEKLKEEKPAELKVEEPKPAVEETKKTEEKPVETPKSEEAKVTPAVAETPAPPETPAPKVQETPASTVEDQKAKDLENKAQEIKTEANTQLNTEQK